MFEKYLERLIKQKLGAFLEGVDENKLNFGVSKFIHFSLHDRWLRQIWVWTTSNLKKMHLLSLKCQLALS